MRNRARIAAMPMGGTIRIASRVKDIKDPHSINWKEASNQSRQVCEYLTMTRQDNVTRP